MRPISKLAFALLLVLPACATHAALPADLDGSWYNPEQSGHGITVERIDPDHALMFWHTFDADGNPLTLYIEGAIDGDRIAGVAYAPSGMRFGSFDPNDFELPLWGEVDLVFSDCSHARLDYRAIDPLLGNGSSDLIRLLPLDRADCDLDAPAGLSALAGYSVEGRMVGQYDAGQPEIGDSSSYYIGDATDGWVDQVGSLYAALLGNNNAGGWQNGHVLIGKPKPSPAGQANLDVTIQPNDWMDPYTGVAASPTPLSDRFSMRLETIPDGASGHVSPVPQGTRRGYLGVNQTSPSRALRAGAYRFGGFGHGVNFSYFSLEVSGDRSLCVRPAIDPALAPPEPPPCVFVGQAQPATATGVFSFTLQASGGTTAPYVGSGRVRYRVLGHPILSRDELSMIGSNGDSGLYLFSTEFAPASN